MDIPPSCGVLFPSTSSMPGCLMRLGQILRLLVDFFWRAPKHLSMRNRTLSFQAIPHTFVIVWRTCISLIQPQRARQIHGFAATSVRRLNTNRYLVPGLRRVPHLPRCITLSRPTFLMYLKFLDRVPARLSTGSIPSFFFPSVILPRPDPASAPVHSRIPHLVLLANQGADRSVDVAAGRQVRSATSR